jgi:hypothetical protein
VTTSRVGGASSGASAAEICFASCLERWKNRGRTSARFSGVITLAISGTAVIHTVRL